AKAQGSNQRLGVPSFCPGVTLFGLPATYGPGIPLTNVQPAVVPDVTLEKLRPPTQSGSRNLEPLPGLPLSLTFAPLIKAVKGVPETAVKIPVVSQPPNTEERTLGPRGEGRFQMPLTTKLCVWFSADNPRSAFVPHS